MYIWGWLVQPGAAFLAAPAVPGSLIATELRRCAVGRSQAALSHCWGYIGETSVSLLSPATQNPCRQNYPWLGTSQSGVAGEGPAACCRKLEGELVLSFPSLRSGFLPHGAFPAHCHVLPCPVRFSCGHAVSSWGREVSAPRFELSAAAGKLLWARPEAGC